MRKILILDDDEQIREMVSAMLENKYDVLISNSVDDAIDYCSKNHVDLIITDLFMPDKTGLDLLDTFRQNNTSINKDIRFIAISGGSKLTKSDFLPVAELIGANGILKKPFTMNELTEKVEAILNNVILKDAV
jgi:two-component system chemotaxis response regulator CheY